MESSYFLLLFIAIFVLTIFFSLFPGILISAVLNHKKKYFYKAILTDNQLLLSGVRSQITIPTNEIKRLSMGPWTLRGAEAAGIRTVQIDTINNSYYVFPSPSNLFAPTFNRDVIKQLRSINPKIELDYYLTKYTDQSLGDMYINKDQIKRGLLSVAIVIIILLFFALLGTLLKEWA